MRVFSIVGTRPDALKMAPVILELNRRQGVEQIVISTGQHREMLRQVLDVFEIQPQHDLDIMLHGAPLAQMTSRILERLDPLLETLKPDLLLAQGDTTTTFVASLGAFYRKIRVGHVEAGLRTDNRYDPFPEEINRRLTAPLADFHFAPTDQAVQNLLRENVAADSIYQVGNTVIDSLLQVAPRPYVFEDVELDRLTSGPNRVVLVTAHRRENLGEPLARICRALKRLVGTLGDVQIVFQMHKNPAVRSVIQAELSQVDRAALIEPQEYLPWVQLMRRSTLILTDSGGIQEEAPALGKPVLVMRETTERPEGVEAGTTRLIGTSEERIFEEAMRLLTRRDAYEAMARAANPYGDGRSAARICDILQKAFQ